jgi:hypothetical protein
VIDGHDERRRHRRFTLRKKAAMTLAPTGEEGAGHLVDMSETGASITAPWSVTVGVGVYIQFVIAPDVACEATGSVVRVFPFGDDFGLAVDLGYANPAFIHFLRNLDGAAEAIRPDYLADIRDLTIRIA